VFPTVALLLASSPEKLTFRSPEMWVYLLGLAILLVIALRRVLARQGPLNDELFAKTVAIEHVQSGVAWVRPDGTIKTINASFASTLGALQRELLGRDWYDMFAPHDRKPIQEGFSQMLLLGKYSLDVQGRRMDGTHADVELLLVAMHDHKMHFVGHYCLIADRTRERLLEGQLTSGASKRQEWRPGMTSTNR
jgi:PAS domain S-box-containing protein